MSILKAEVSIVKIGNREVEGLMFEDGSFGIGVLQIVKLFPYFSSKTSDLQRNGSKLLKRLMGKDFKTSKCKAFNQNRYSLAISVDDFSLVIKALFKKSDVIAEQLFDELFGLSLQQLFSDAFNIKFEKEERQRYLRNRQEGKVARKTFDDVVASYIQNNEVSASYKNYIFINYSDCINRALFGKTSKQLCNERGCDRHSLRDTHSASDLKMIEYIENYARICVEKSGMEPLEAIKAAIDFNITPRLF